MHRGLTAPLFKEFCFCMHEKKTIYGEAMLICQSFYPFPAHKVIDQ
jgi:hypothetical protein